MHTKSVYEKGYISLCVYITTINLHVMYCTFDREKETSALNQRVPVGGTN